MKEAGQFVVSSLVRGLLVVVPVYLSVLLLLKGMQSVVGLTRPLAMLLPASVPAEALSLILVLALCVLVGAAVRTSGGQAIQGRLERALFDRIPGYALIRSLTQRLAGQGEANVWKPALAEIEDGLVPAFIVEELDDGRFPFTEAVRAVSRWGAGAKDLVAAMERGERVRTAS